MFAGCRFFLVKKGLSKKRCKLIEDRLAEKGGQVVADEAQATHIVASTSDLSPKSAAIPVTYDWISRCLMAGAVIPVPNVKTCESPVPSPTGNGKLPEQTVENFTSKVDPSELQSHVNERVPKRLKLGDDDSISDIYDSDDDSVDNQYLINQIQKLVDRYQVQGDTWRTLSYKRAVATLKNHHSQIRSVQDVKGLPNIGASVSNTIKEILETGHSMKADNPPESVRILSIFMNIHGVGHSIAQKWYNEGMRSLEDIKKRTDLSQVHLLGLKYYDDTLVKIPREQVELIGKQVESYAHELDDQANLLVMGSFRRGAKECGDVDCIIFSDRSLASDFLDTLVTKMTDANFVVATLTLGHNAFLGVCKYNNMFRRLDIWTVPNTERGSTLMHFTGSALFNRYIRKLARTKGMSLSRHGLFSVKSGERIAGDTEEGIFEALEIPYRPPEERCF